MQEHEEVNVAIVGAGGEQAAEDHVPALADRAGEGVTVAAAVDVNVAKARSVAETFGIPAVYRTLEEMLTARRDPAVRDLHPAVRDLNAVVLAVPNGLHGPFAKKALQAGLDVFVEKPMAPTYRTALEMAELARSVGRLLFVSQLYHMRTRMLPAIVAERLGQVEWVRAEWLRKDGIPDRPTFTKEELSGGGAGMDLIPHLLSVVLPALGMPKPVRVSARTSAARGQQKLGSDFEVEDRLQGVVDFAHPDPRKRVHLGIDVGWAVDVEDEELVRVVFEGPKGKLEARLRTGQPHTPGFDPEGQPDQLFVVAGGTTEDVGDPVWSRPLWDCITEQTGYFVEAVRAHRRGETNSEEVGRAKRSVDLGLRSTQIIDGFYASAAHSGRQVELAWPRRG
jgi:predicted dehydrogenase